jgi:hypothetical protein
MPDAIGAAGSDGSTAAPIINPLGGMPSSISYFALRDEQFEQLFNNEMKGKSFIRFSPMQKNSWGRTRRTREYCELRYRSTMPFGV